MAGEAAAQPWYANPNFWTVANASALQWFSTATGKPIQTGAPRTAMGDVFGTDFSGGPTVEGRTFGAIGPILVLAIIAGAVVLIVRR
jgi:hypothetical protein